MCSLSACSSSLSLSSSSTELPPPLNPLLLLLYELPLLLLQESSSAKYFPFLRFISIAYSWFKRSMVAVVPPELEPDPQLLLLPDMAL